MDCSQLLATSRVWRPIDAVRKTKTLEAVFHRPGGICYAARIFKTLSGPPDFGVTPRLGGICNAAHEAGCNIEQEWTLQYQPFLKRNCKFFNPELLSKIIIFVKI
jgi:hypothetical protein